MKKVFKGVVLMLAYLLFFATISSATPVYYAINAGGWSYETGWSITQTSGGAWSDGMARGSMAYRVTYAYDWDLDPGGYNLTVTDTYGDGLDGGGGLLQLIVDGTTLLDRTGNVFSSRFVFDFIVPGQSAAPVPEPSTFLLVGAGLLGLGWYGRKRKQM